MQIDEAKEEKTMHATDRELTERILAILDDMKATIADAEKMLNESQPASAKRLFSGVLAEIFAGKAEKLRRVARNGRAQ